MMLAGQAQMMGIGSGQLSGVRPGAGTRGTRGRQTQPVGQKPRQCRRSLAAWRLATSTARLRKLRIPQGFYNRQNRHYPQVGR